MATVIALAALAVVLHFVIAIILVRKYVRTRDLGLVGITQTPTATIHHQTKVSDFPYRRLQGYYGQYVFAAKVKEAETQAGHPTGTVQQIAKPYIELMKRRDIALGAAYHIHSEPK